MTGLRLALVTRGRDFEALLLDLQFDSFIEFCILLFTRVDLEQGPRMRLLPRPRAAYFRWGNVLAAGVGRAQI